MLETSYTFHRADLQNALLEHLGTSANLHLGKRLVSYIQRGDGDEAACPLELRFQDGSGAVCDVLVGADGVRSAVRGAMYNQLADAAFTAGREQEATALRSHVRPVHSGLVVYRSLIRKEDLSQEEAAHPALNRQGVMLVSSISRPLKQTCSHRVCVLRTVLREEQGTGNVVDKTACDMD